MARRTRPKTYRHGSDHAKLRQRWRRWLPGLRQDLTHLLGKREIFWELQEVAKENKRVLNPGAFFEWMCQNYVVTVSVGIRSFTRKLPLIPDTPEVELSGIFPARRFHEEVEVQRDPDRLDPQAG